MASIPLPQLMRELHSYRQRKLRHSNPFRVGWQPLAKNASPAEGAHVSIFNQFASDFEWQLKVLQYQRAPFWRRWYWRLFTTQVSQLELFFYTRFTLFFHLLRRTSSPSLYQVRLQHLCYYLRLAQRTLPPFSSLVLAIKRGLRAPERNPAPAASLPPDSPLPNDALPSLPEKLSLDGDYYYLLLQQQLRSERQRLSRLTPRPLSFWQRCRGAVSPPTPASSPAWVQRLRRHTQRMLLAYHNAILSETDFFRRQAWINRRRYALRQLRQHTHAIGITLRIPVSAPAFPWLKTPSAASFSQNLFKVF